MRRMHLRLADDFFEQYRKSTGFSGRRISESLQRRAAMARPSGTHRKHIRRTMLTLH